MIPPCSIINEQFLPTIRGLTARRLGELGHSQSVIADALGVSQAMVSKYLSRPQVMEPFPEIEQLALEAADLIIHGADRASLTGLVCKWCFAFKEKGKLCSHHPVDSCSVCMNLRSEEGIGERLRVLEDLEQAIGHLDGTDASVLSPQVRINIARALPESESSMDIAAIPGRLIPLTRGFRTLAPPEFGASRHLSMILLAAMGRDPEIRAVMNIRYDQTMDRVLRKGELKVGFLDRTQFGGIIEFIGSPAWDREEVIVDVGDFGIEPCTYVFGPSAVRVVDRALTLVRSIGSPGEPRRIRGNDDSTIFSKMTGDTK
jgi:XRE family transcriptional regulator, thiamine biosynthesis regulator